MDRRRSAAANRGSAVANMISPPALPPTTSFAAQNRLHIKQQQAANRAKAQEEQQRAKQQPFKMQRFKDIDSVVLRQAQSTSRNGGNENTSRTSTETTFLKKHEGKSVVKKGLNSRIREQIEQQTQRRVGGAGREAYDDEEERRVYEDDEEGDQQQYAEESIYNLASAARATYITHDNHHQTAHRQTQPPQQRRRQTNSHQNQRHQEEKEALSYQSSSSTHSRSTSNSSSSSHSSPIASPIASPHFHQPNFIAANALSVIHTSAASVPSPIEAPTKHAAYGKVPLYLQQRKSEAITKQQEALKKKQLEKVPAGMKQISETERIDTLTQLQASHVLIEQQLSALPLRIETISRKKQKEELEKKLADLEAAIQLFQKKIVYITI